MKKEMLKKIVVLGMVVLAIMFIAGQIGVYAEDDLNLDIENNSEEKDSEENKDEDEDALSEENELSLPEKDEDTTLTTQEKDDDTDITLKPETETKTDSEELPYTGTVSNTVMISIVVALVGFGVYAIRKANYYKNI